MIYLDNAATTRLDDEVIEEMTTIMKSVYGNPSSIHQQGRISRVIIEEARKKIAGYLNVLPAEIIFTSGGTEAINIAIASSKFYLGVKNIITSSIEHPAVINTIKFFSEREHINVKHVRFTERGHIDLNHLEELLKSTENALVCLMHANNEISNLLPLKETEELCKKYNTLFFSDMVQTMCKFQNNLKEINLDFTACSGHKFHGPKGIGFLYMNKNLQIKSTIHGGGQERNIRSGTENIYGIAGLAKAFEIAHRDMDKNQNHILSLKQYLKEKFQTLQTDIQYNGESENSGLYTILNASFPLAEKNKMLVQKLDIKGICVSGGSACHSAEETVSYVIRNIGTDINRISIRFSFSKYNSKEDIDQCIQALSEILKR